MRRDDPLFVAAMNAARPDATRTRPAENIDPQYQRVMQLLLANKRKDFVQRILSPQTSPHLTSEDGRPMTHFMEWGDAGDSAPRYVVSPRIQNTPSGLVNFGDQAFDRAQQTGEFIQFPMEAEADWFSRAYKLAWPE